MTVVTPEPGQVVIVRQRPYVVTGIQRSGLPSPATIHDNDTIQHMVSSKVLFLPMTTQSLIIRCITAG